MNPSPVNQKLLTGTEVMALLGYKDRGAFWDMVHRNGVPHVQINRRVLRFPEQGLRDWVERRSTDRP
jgi:predicted DNA-binding transcriptional regulator AlpA